MSLPTMKPDRDALYSSLSDALVYLGTDNRNVRPGVPQPSLSLPQAQLNSVARGAFDSTFLPSQQQSLFSQSLGLASTPVASMWEGPTLQTAASSLGFTPGGILLAAAAASKRSQLLEQAKASLIQQQNTEECKLLLLQNSYFSLLQDRGAGFQSQAVLPQLAHPTQVDPARVLGGEVLEALGTNLRAKSDPYIDVSGVVDPIPEEVITLCRTRGGVCEPFPVKLHRMLSDVEKDNISDVVSFASHGRSFSVHDMDKFVSQVMPKYFKQTKWNSFARQLNMYGFIRITSGPNAGGYYHELFLKGRPNLCLHMRRVGVPHGEDRRKVRPKNTNERPTDCWI